MKKQKTKVLIVLATLFFLFSQANAQENNIGTPNGIDCFDYYKFQSVQVSLGNTKDFYKPGEKIIFQGEIVNQNDYPIVNGDVFARIGKKNPNYTREGNFTIDEFFPIENVNLDSLEKKPASFEWVVPKDATGGTYHIDFFFLTGRKYVLGGLPFTNEVVIGGTDFEVKSDNSSQIYFDKSQTKVNNLPYKHIGNWPSIDAGGKIEIKQPLKNTFSTEQKVNIKYELFYWDSLNEKDKIITKEENIVVAAKSTYDLSHLIPTMSDSVYYLKITAEGMQKSIVNLRFVSGQNHLRLNFPAINKFPLIKNENATLFSCFHNTFRTPIPGKVEVTLSDSEGKEITKLNYQGDISGAMMAEKKEFQPQKDYGWAKLAAKITDDQGKIMDEYEAVYDCNQLNSAKCKNVSTEKEGRVTNTQENKSKFNLFIILILALSLVLILAFELKKKKNRYIKTLIFLVVSISVFSFSQLEAKAYYGAKECVQTKSNYRGLQFYPPCSSDLILRDTDFNCPAINDSTDAETRLKCLCPNTAVSGFINGSFITSVNQRIAIESGGYMDQTGTIHVTEGETLKFVYVPDNPFFNLYGIEWSSPYGTWCNPITANNKYSCTYPSLDDWYYWGSWLQNSYPSGVCGNPDAEKRAYPMFVTATAAKPTAVTLNPKLRKMVCNGMDCVAPMEETSDLISVNLGETSVGMWVRKLTVKCEGASGNYKILGSPIKENFNDYPGGGVVQSGDCSNLQYPIQVHAPVTLTVNINGPGKIIEKELNGSPSSPPITICENNTLVTKTCIINTLSYGDQISLEAKPNAGYDFSQWFDSCTGTNPNSCAIQLAGSKTVGAYFVTSACQCKPPENTICSGTPYPDTCGNVSACTGNLDCGSCTCENNDQFCTTHSDSCGNPSRCPGTKASGCTCVKDCGDTSQYCGKYADFNCHNAEACEGTKPESECPTGWKEINSQ
jgi:hypothetical protein